MIERNALHCRTCDTVIESTHRHHFVGCRCEHGSGTWIFVDGGHDYQRFGFEDNAVFDDLSVITDDTPSVN